MTRNSDKTSQTPKIILGTEHPRRASRASSEISVNATFDGLWDVLLDEMDHPDRYSATILSATVLERFPEGLLRKVQVPDAEVRERLEYHYGDGTVVSTLVGHPELVGVITKKVLRNPDGSLALSSTLEWQSIEARVEEMLTRNVHDFMMDQLHKLKAAAETRHGKK